MSRSVTLIDPVALREKQQRQRRRASRERVTEQALSALAWFHDFGMDAVEGGPRQLRAEAMLGTGGLGGSGAVPMLLTASATSGVKDGWEYVRRAYLEQRLAILTRAVELAQADLDENEVRETPR